MSYGQPGWGPQQPQVVVVQSAPVEPLKDVGTAYMLLLFLGFWGAHKFGLFMDLFLLAGQVREHNEYVRKMALFQQQQMQQALRGGY